MRKEITVILPVYNGLEFLGISVESVLNQTFADFELIICDDSSTDTSFSFLKNYKDERIQLIRNEENLGLFPTLNKMIKMSKGRLIKLWSQDDIMLESCLAETVAFHNQYPDISFSYSDRYIINERGEIINSITVENDTTPEYITKELHDKIAFYTGSIAGNIANATIRSDVLQEVEYFNEKMKISADFEMWVKLTADYNIGRIRKPLVKLRDHANQLSRATKYYLRHMKEDLVVFDKLIKRNDKPTVDFGMYYLNWRKAPLYFSFLLQTVKSGQISDAIKFAKEMSKHFNLPAAIVRWGALKFFKKKIKKPDLR